MCPFSYRLAATGQTFNDNVYKACFSYYAAYLIGNKTLFINWHQLFPWFWMSEDLLDSFTFRMFHLADVSYSRFQKRYFLGNENPSMTLAYDHP